MDLGPFGALLELRLTTDEWVYYNILTWAGSIPSVFVLSVLLSVYVCI